MLSPIPQSEKYGYPGLNHPQEPAQPDGVTQEAGDQG